MLSSSDFEERFRRLKEKVLVKRPILAEVLRKKGSKNLYDYVKEYVSVNLNPPIKRRQNEFLATFQSEVTRLYNPEVAASAVRQLKKHYFVSTADHQGPICHPFFVNSNLLTAAPYVECEDPDLRYVVVLSCANVSVDNSSFPRGLIFHSLVGQEMQLHRLAFFSSNTRPSVVYNLKPYGQAEIDKIKHLLRVKVDKKEMLPKHGEKVASLFDSIYANPEILASPSYSEQIIKSNYLLWKEFFGPSEVPPPELLYIEMESLVVRLLIENHLYSDTIVNHFLFDPAYEPLILKYFEGIFGSFSRQDMSGTYMFWALPKGQKYCLQLFRKGNFLVSKDESYRIELNPDVIKKGLEEKELIPSLMLNFFLVSFYYGLKCLGGFNQVNYLTYMKNAYIKMNADLGNYRSIEVCARAQTKEICDGLTIAFLQDPQGKMTLATGLDLILYGHEKTWPDFIELCKHITFEEALNPLMPEIYRISYPDTEWEENLLTITDQDITKHTGLNKKIKPCAYL